MKIKKIILILFILMFTGLACSLSIPGMGKPETPANNQDTAKGTTVMVKAEAIKVSSSTPTPTSEKEPAAESQEAPDSIVEMDPSERPTSVAEEESATGEAAVLPTPYEVKKDQVKPLVVDSQTIVNAKGSPYGVFKITNPNSQISFSNIFYNAAIFDSSDYELGRSVGSLNLIRPGETVTLVNYLFPKNLDDITKIKSVKFNFDSATYGGYDQFDPYQSIKALEFDENNGASQIRGTIKNNLNAVIQNSNLHVAAYKGDKVVGAALIGIPNSPPLSEIPVLAFIDVSETPDKVEGFIDNGTINTDLLKSGNPLTVVQTGYSVSQYGSPAYVGFVVRNNRDKQYDFSSYVVNAYDKDGKVLSVMTGSIYHIPAKSEISLSTAIALSGKSEIIDKIEVHITPGEEEPTTFKNPFSFVKGTYDPKKMVLSVKVKNVTSKTINYPSLHFTAFNAKGKVMAGNSGSYAHPVEPNEIITITTDLYLPDVPKWIEVFPSFDVSVYTPDSEESSAKAKPTVPSILGVDLPEAPSGFSWKTAPGLAFLIPDGWFYKTEKSGSTTTYYVTQEELKKKTDILYTGMNIKVVDNVPDAEAAALKFIDDYSKSKQVSKVVSNTKRRQGEFTLIQLNAEIKDPAIKSDDPRRVKNVILLCSGQPQSKRLVQILFEAPTVEWDSIYDVTSELLNHVVMIEDLE